MNYSLDKETTVTGIIIEARMTSSRLPGKVLMPACGKPMLTLQVERLKKVAGVDKIILATTTNDTDEPLVSLAHDLGISCFRGSEDDVLSRVVSAAQAEEIDLIVEIMGDCPLIDPASVDDVIQAFWDNKPDYASAALSNTYPLGTEAQVYPTKLLAHVDSLPVTQEEREHVTLYIYRHPDKYKILPVEAPDERKGYGIFLTLDERHDYDCIKQIFEALYPKKSDFTLQDIFQFLEKNPDVKTINSHVERTKI